MMNLILSLALTTTILPLVHASKVGNAIVFNNCTDTTVYLWSVGSAVNNTATIDTGNSYSEEFRYDDRSGGISLKLTTVEDGIYNGSPETDFAYTLNDHTIVWYDISDVNGDPFAGHTVALIPSDPSCQSFIWEDGVSPSGIHTASCSAEVDLVLTLCQDS